MRVLFVCTGNICRSPTAAGVFADLVRRAGLEDAIHVESAGTHDYHVGEAPDPRAQEHARRRGYDLSALRARRVRKADFAAFDVIVAMDRGHLEILEHNCPPQERGKLRLLVKGRDVPDPYYGGPEGFEHVLDLVEGGCLALLSELKDRITAG
ncbi:MAG: low molecular weight phosphotyrosine protein phosphatase [Betaproteobacteria bacterium]|nr:low molecular weight phosphotyrosine protein phosphatase [Betaproteobacteria bacterium]